MNHIYLVLGIVLVAGLVAERTAEAATAPAFKIIANPAVPASALTAAELEGLFLKKTTRWKDGQACVPADLRLGNEAREAFSAAVLHRSSKAVHSYWQQKIFTGQGTPPPQLADDAAVVAFVARTPGAIAYVSDAANLASVRVITVEE